MVFVINESKAAKIFENYKNVAAFTLDGKSSSYKSDDKVVVSYKKADMLPDKDTINAVLEGHMSAKKVIKKAVKSLKKPAYDVRDKKGKTNRVALSMGVLVNILSENEDVPENKSKKWMKKWEKSHGPSVIVFVYEDDADKNLVKFLTKYVEALFGLFGYAVLTPKTGKKVLKKVFTGGAKKNAVRVRRFIENNVENGMGMSKKGYKLFQLIRMWYSTEYIQMSLDNTVRVKDDDGNLVDVPLIKENRDSCEKLAKHLVRFMSGNVNAEICLLMNPEKKSTGKLSTLTKRKAVAMIDYYNELADILKGLGDEFKLPKIDKYGNTKKSRKEFAKTLKLKDLKPKMNAKKVIKFFVDKENRPFLRIVYAHICARMIGVEIGSSEYSRVMSNSINVGGLRETDFSKVFTSAAKKWANAAKKADI